MIIGRGWTGISTANEVADLGFQVLLIEDSELIDKQDLDFWIPSCGMDRATLLDEYAKLETEKQIEYLPRTDLKSCQGGVGNFVVELENEKGSLQRTVGAIVLAKELKAKPLFAEFGLEKSPNAVSLFDLEKKLESDALNRKQEWSGNRVVFLSGFHQEENILAQRRIMECVSELSKRGAQPYIYTRDLKLADKDLEKLYKESIEQGAIYFKTEQEPSIFANGEWIGHTDPVLQREVQLQADFLVVEEALTPSSNSLKLLDVFNINPGRDGLLQENNIHRLPVCTNRRGIFVAGSLRRVMTLEEVNTDAANVALNLHNCFEKIKEQYSSSRASIDKDKCCFCLTCYRCCPHGAIRLEDKPVISSLDCQGCGICASECPQEAISLIDVQVEEIKDSISKMFKQSEQEYTPKIIACCCQNSAYEAGMAAYKFDLDLPPGLEIVRVPCAGSINLDLVLSSLHKGADGVLIMGCHQDACKSVNGNTFAYHRNGRLQSILEEVGFSKDRVCFHTLAENMEIEFAQYAREMEGDLKELGPNPLLQTVSNALI